MSVSNDQPQIVLQPRDYDIFVDLYESRIMTREHIAHLHFNDREEATKKRIGTLVKTKYIGERPRLPNEKAMLFLARKGYLALCEAGKLQGYPQTNWEKFQKRTKVGKSNIPHELDVMTVKSRLVSAIKKERWLSIAEFSTWPDRSKFATTREVREKGWVTTKAIQMKPDGFIRIHEISDEGIAEYCFFLEVDRSEEKHAIVASKALGYRSYYQSGGFAERMGYDPANPAICPFRCLFIFLTDERRNNVAAYLSTLNPPIKGQAWLSTLGDLENDPLAPIWILPGEYAKLTKDTPYAPKRLRKGEMYRSDSVRDQWIDTHISKHRLLE